MNKIIVYLFGLGMLTSFILLVGCSHATYRENYVRTPAKQKSETAGRRTFRITQPDGARFIVQITPEPQPQPEGE